MEVARRTFLRLATRSALLPLLSRVAWAQAYPTRPVHMSVGFAAGQSIERSSAAHGSVALRAPRAAIRHREPARRWRQYCGGGRGGASPDGYTLLVIGANNAINATLYKKLNFNLLRDVVPVAGIYRVRQVMEVHPSFPARTVTEFIACAKANPGKVNFASAGNGSVAHVSAELFKMMAGVSMVHVAYRGAPAALTDLFGGHVHVMFDNLPSSIEYIRTGSLRALGVSSPARLVALPDVPAVAETIPGFETVAFAGIGAPKDTPASIVDKLNAEVNAGLADPMI